MDIPFLREAGYSVRAVVPYTASATREGQGWLTLTNGLDNITLTDVTPRELDALGRAIRYAAAKLETLAMTKQRYTGHLPVASLPGQQKAEPDKWFDEMLEEHGDPVG